MKVPQIIGADLSKKTIDFYHAESQSHLCIENSLQGFKKMIKWLKSLKVDPSEVMIVMEHTGLYGYLLEEFLHSLNVNFSKVNAVEIKRSIGLVRGKSDRIDAARIAEYGKRNYEKLFACKPPSTTVKELKMLHATRDRLVKQKAALQCSIKEYQNIGLAATHPVMKSQMQIMRVLAKEILILDEAIKKAVRSDEDVNRNVTLLKSIKGVGEVLAVATVIKTENFSRFSNARKFACFCGTAPFEHQSGSSLKKKARVSDLADKSMKTLLDLSAKTGIQHDPELKEYYRRRTGAGKAKMSTINIVRNKIIYRMFAVIKRGTPFQQLAA